MKDGRQSKCRHCLNKAYNEKRSANRDYYNNYERLRRYGINQEQYNAIWEKQGKCCAICKTKDNQNGKTWAIDHSHESNEVRGILCDNCNWLLGHAKDDIHILDSAMRYLVSKMEVLNGNGY